MKYITYTSLTNNGGRRIIIHVQVECVVLYSGLLAVKLKCTPAISEGWFIRGTRSATEEWCCEFYACRYNWTAQSTFVSQL